MEAVCDVDSAVESAMGDYRRFFCVWWRAAFTVRLVLPFVIALIHKAAECRCKHNASSVLNGTDTVQPLFVRHLCVMAQVAPRAVD